ncbi:PREDICTED: BPTI/Kunitz domain-containing protein-like [Sturnus vulgaris]|uniref:BPTI/Kunitz domain-containing protein-like n=1 Tax=Sturnus vulgaris TaxID=9172 RepID=UPI00071A8482|nr:PREDICTED: BPTI/Kunitz domain-containing protein-like [Sturnus vulgaris]
MVRCPNLGRGRREFRGVVSGVGGLLSLSKIFSHRCRLPAVPGRCRASIPRWFFDAPSGRCRRFVFGGCGGNGNNFGSESECRESCDPSSPAPTNSTSPEGCSGPPVPGPCRAAFPRWYFIPEENSCREFTYGGCRGSANNHRDEQECLRRCRATKGGENAPKTALKTP